MYPFNCDIISDEDFLPAEATDRVDQPATPSDPAEIPVTSAPVIRTLPSRLRFGSRSRARRRNGTVTHMPFSRSEESRSPLLKSVARTNTSESKAGRTPTWQRAG